MEITEFDCHGFSLKFRQINVTLLWIDLTGKICMAVIFSIFHTVVRNNLVSLWQNFVKSTDLITRLLWIIGNLISRNFLFESVQSHYHITPLHNRSSNSFSQFLLTVHRSLRMKFMATSGHPLGKNHWPGNDYVQISLCYLWFTEEIEYFKIFLKLCLFTFSHCQY